MSKWEEKMLGELIISSKGKLTKQSEFPEDGFQRLINADAINGRATIFSDTKGAVLCEEDDVLMLWDGERSGLVTFGFKGVVGSTFAKLKTIVALDSKYLFYFLNEKFLWIQNNRTGTGVPHVPKDLERILIVKYPKDKTEQRKIATILSTADAVIEKTQAAIAKYKAIKQGMLQDLFTRGIDTTTCKLRPSYQDAPELYKESKLGWIPKEWEEMILKDIVDRLSPVTYGIVQPGKFDQNGVLLIRGQDYISGWAMEPEFFRVSENLHKQFIRSKTTKGDILICIVGATYGAVTVVPDWIVEANITQTTARIRCDKNTFSSSFLEYYLKSDFGKYFINKYVKGSAQPGLNLGDVDKFIIKFPKDIQEQNLIGSRLRTIDNKINSEVEYLHKQQQIKAGLMHDLLSGKKKVVVIKELESQTENN